MAKKRANIKVNGIVQGVGFRPFIHKQIGLYRLLGWIRNTSAGAEIEVEGEECDLKIFEEELWTKSPKLALIESVHTEYFQELRNYDKFEIIESKGLKERDTLISPDVCICEDCLREMRDPENRRYRYPFINCTNCGPRFTIIKDVPYDRCKTTMAEFPMCGPCETEYKDIEDRRYHAQPTCCEDCGPELIYETVTEVPGERPVIKKTSGDPIKLAAELLKGNKILALKGLGGIHLACTVENPENAVRLRLRKHRDEKPFAIMCRDLGAVRKYAEISKAEEALLTSVKRPIVLLKKKPGVNLDHISENGYVGIMLPYTPVHYLLMDEGFDALIMTSANLSDLPIIYKNEEAEEKLAGIADAFLLNNRDIHVRCDDSLVWEFDGKEYPARRSRGYVPFPVILQNDLGCGLALGAEQKASFCMSKGNYAFPSQHIGDLKNIESFENYRFQIGHFERLFDIKPEFLCCDLHPDYMSTEYAEMRASKEGLPLFKLQHHYAHMCSCMADNRLEEPCIGVIWDGTGLGDDGGAWGMEFFAGDLRSYERLGSMHRIFLPGGDKAAKDLWRTGISALIDCGEDPSEFFEDDECEAVRALLEMGINVPAVSSMGRLFDAASALLGIKRNASYEGQGAILLEASASDFAHPENGEAYPFEIYKDGDLWRFDHRPIFRQMCEDVRRERTRGEIAAAFMNSCVDAAAEMCGRISEQTDLKTIVLSGGSFQNMYMLRKLINRLEGRGFSVYHHSRVSANDEGISLGQLAAASARMRK